MSVPEPVDRPLGIHAAEEYTRRSNAMIRAAAAVMALSVAAVNLFAQTTRWVRQFGTSGDDAGYGIAVDGSGNVYVTGGTFGGLDGNHSIDSFDIFVAKYRGTGAKEWIRQFGTSGDDAGYGIAVDGSGNVYVTGGTFGGLDGNSWGGRDIFVAKYSSAGVREWVRQFGTSGDDAGYGIAVDGSGNVYVTGGTFGGLDGNSWGGRDIFVAKYSSAGVREWVRQFGTSGDDAGNGIAVDGSGNVYVTGWVNPSMDSFGIFVAKYSGTGVRQWVRQLGTNGWDAGNGIAVDGSGNVYVTGETLGRVGGNPSAGGRDIFVVKYSSTEVKEWIRRFGTSGDDAGNGIAMDGSGNVYVTGGTFGRLDGNSSAGGRDIFVVKYSSTGAKQWIRQFGTSGDDVGDDIAVDGSGNVYVTGKTEGDLDGNLSAGVEDVFIWALVDR
jgi:hypothetical protein